jgi:hypothetical protein
MARAAARHVRKIDWSGRRKRGGEVRLVGLAVVEARQRGRSREDGLERPAAAMAGGDTIGICVALLVSASSVVIGMGCSAASSGADAVLRPLPDDQPQPQGRRAGGARPAGPAVDALPADRAIPGRGADRRRVERAALGIDQAAGGKPGVAPSAGRPRRRSRELMPPHQRRAAGHLLADAEPQRRCPSEARSMCPGQPAARHRPPPGQPSRASADRVDALRGLAWRS